MTGFYEQSNSILKICDKKTPEIYAKMAKNYF
jgi:hypothetical protein